MVRVKLFVEGGGNKKTLKRNCRRGFRKFIEKAGLGGRMPAIVACGGRQEAYSDFKKALSDEDCVALLLVDAEAPVTLTGVWQHLKERDGWERPETSVDSQCHLMVQVMESWFLADRKALQDFYGNGYISSRLPPAQHVEQIAKSDVLKGLTGASVSTTKGRYSKGAHSFDILAKLDPAMVRKASAYADRFVCELKNSCK